MTIKTTATTVLLASALMAGASADTLLGRVYQITESDIYVKMPNTVVARVPAQTAQFYVQDHLTPWTNLRAGQFVRVEYVPAYGFQHLYHGSDKADVDLADGETIWYEGSTDRVYPEEYPYP